MKIIILLILVSLFNSNVQSQDNIISSPDSGLKILTASSKEVVVPDALKGYAGIRFIDVRYLKEFIGFLPSPNDKKIYKLKAQDTFEAELNNISLLNKADSVSKTPDSIIVVIKNFWFNRNQDEKSRVYCHVSALFFVKKNSDVFFDYKIDTFFNYKDLFGDFYKICIDKSINDLLLSYTKPAAGLAKKYSVEEFNANVHKKRVGPKNVTDSTGLFLTYKDFLNGNLYKIAVDLNPFFDQFTFTIKDESLNVKLHKSIWGLMYKGELYIRTETLLCKAFLVEGTYIARSNIEVRGASSGNNTPVVIDETNNSTIGRTMALGSAAIVNLLQSKKAKVKSHPVILNIETGELE